MHQQNQVPFRVSTAWPEWNDGFHYKDYIKRDFANCKVIDFYTQKYKDSGGKALWLERIRNHQISVNDQVVSEDYILKVSDVLSYHRLPWREPPAPESFDVVYSSQSLVAINKPPGLQVLPASFFHQRTVLSLLRGHPWEKGGRADEQALEVRSETGGAKEGGEDGEGKAKDKGGKGSKRQAKGEDGLHVPAPVHRLGRGTSGLLLCARTKEARQSLTKALEDKTSLAEDWEAFALKGGETEGRGMGKVGGEGEGERKLERNGEKSNVLDPCSPAHGFLSTSCAVSCSSPVDSSSFSLFSPAPAAALTAIQRQFLIRHRLGGFATSPSDDSASPSSPGQSTFPEPAIRKIYLALVEGLVREDEGLIDARIGPVPFPGVRNGVFAASPEGKPALSLFRVLRRSPRRNVSLLQVEIFSGRPHQIRIHCASMGHPLYQDPLYINGGKPRMSSCIDALDPDAELDPTEVRPGSIGYFLHAYQVRIPIEGGEPVWITAPVPKDIQVVMDEDESVEGKEQSI